MKIFAFVLLCILISSTGFSKQNGILIGDARGIRSLDLIDQEGHYLTLSLTREIQYIVVDNARTRINFEQIPYAYYSGKKLGTLAEDITFETYVERSGTRKLVRIDIPAEGSAVYGELAATSSASHLGISFNPKNKAGKKITVTEFE